jgi:hypothetical protein
MTIKIVIFLRRKVTYFTESRNPGNFRSTKKESKDAPYIGINQQEKRESYNFFQKMYNILQI